ncbi:MAG TPA: cytochrome c [Rhizomicrobium sp.]|nr:cytochrome c [Rhizomicrobium sp.]
MRGALAALLLLAASGAAQAQDQAAAGRYQAILGDCQGCHTAPGSQPFAGGLVLETPFGNMTVPNITQDRATGIGGWSEADFRRAVRDGIAPDGKRLYPAMPYPAYTRMSDADLASLWAYLKTVAPAHHAVEADHLRFPFNIRALMAGWDWLYFKPGRFAPVEGKSAAWNRGAYLVNGPGHCGACHTAKTLFGADGPDALTGASLQGWFAPEITGAKPRGVGGWSADDVVAYLKSGWNSHAVASGPMAEVVERSTAQMTDGDLEAVALYLKDQPAAQGQAPAAVAANDPAVAAGKILYQNNCTACHGANGKGESLMFPPLAGNPVLLQSSAENLIRVVLAGAQAVSTPAAPTGPSMPSFAWKLNDAQLADLLTYVRNSWGNQAPPVGADSVSTIRANLRSGS